MVGGLEYQIHQDREAHVAAEIKFIKFKGTEPDTIESEVIEK